jgi:hypothetical protein
MSQGLASSLRKLHIVYSCVQSLTPSVQTCGVDLSEY